MQKNRITVPDYFSPQNPDDLLRDIDGRTDCYFKRTKAVLERFGDALVTYVLFMRRPVIAAPALMCEWLFNVAAAKETEFKINLFYEEGEWVGAGEPLLQISGKLSELSETETLLLQKIGPASVAALQAYLMSKTLPHIPFLAMDARHCAGAEMQHLMAYGASVGSRKAQKEGAKGFIGNANDATAHYFGQKQGFGTMPHSIIGYAGSTLRAAELYAETFPDENLTVLVDYFGREITDALEVCHRFPDLCRAGKLSFRLDTHGGRFLEGLDPAGSYDVLNRNAPQVIRRYNNETARRFLMGTGVSAAAVWRMREALNEAGFEQAKIIASSGFDETKCRIMADAKAPIDMIGTGSFIPNSWRETYATADIISYNGVSRVKIGREFLHRPKSEMKSALSDHPKK